MCFNCSSNFSDETFFDRCDHHIMVEASCSCTKQTEVVAQLAGGPLLAVAHPNMNNLQQFLVFWTVLNVSRTN